VSNALLHEAEKLTIAERVELVEAIWNSIPAAADATMLPVPEAHKRVVDERLAEIEANPSAGDSWEDVRARLERDLIDSCYTVS